VSRRRCFGPTPGYLGGTDLLIELGPLRPQATSFESPWKSATTEFTNPTRQDCSIHGAKQHSSRLPAQDRQLMPEHQDLDLLRALRSALQHDQLQQATERHIRK
jgi:hypothetical protein